MKTTISLYVQCGSRLLSALCVLMMLVFTGCSGLSERERLLVGRWDSSYTERDISVSDEEDYLSFDYITESVDEFRSDHTNVEEGVTKFKFYFDFEDLDDYYCIVMKYRDRYEGTWKLEGDKLHLRCTSLESEFVSAEEVMDDSDVDIDEEYYIDFLKNYVDDFYDELRSQLREPRTQSVVSLTDNEFTWEEDGETQTEYRLK